jgi:hypothetical protein
VLVGTARHESSHAIAAAAQGARIEHIQLLPSFLDGAGLLWGSVSWSGGHPGWKMTAAPYFCDVLFFSGFFLLCTFAHRMPQWLWINCLVIGLLSPFVNTAYNYSKLFWRSDGDVNTLVFVFGGPRIHILFLTMLGVFAAGIWFAIHLRAKNPAFDN